jgi:hypothetical protein
MPVEANPFAQTPALAELAETLRKNVSKEERRWSLAGGAAMLATRWRSPGGKWLGRGLGVALLLRAITGHCLWYYYAGRDTRNRNGRP